MTTKEKKSSRSIDLRGYLPFPFLSRCYLVFQVGIDRRGKNVAVEQERRQVSTPAAFLFGSIVILGSLCLTGFAAFLAAYALKSSLGIDLLRSSPMHHLLTALRICH